MESHRDGEDGQWWNTVPASTLRAALTLSQVTWWVDSETTPHLVDALTPVHRLAVIAYLAEHSRTLLLDVQETAVRGHASSAASRAAARLAALDFALDDSDAWVESTPLMRRLRQLSRAGQ